MDRIFKERKRAQTSGTGRMQSTNSPALAVKPMKQSRLQRQAMIKSELEACGPVEAVLTLFFKHFRVGSTKATAFLMAPVETKLKQVYTTSWKFAGFCNEINGLRPADDRDHLHWVAGIYKKLDKANLSASGTSILRRMLLFRAQENSMLRGRQPVNQVPFILAIDATVAMTGIEVDASLMRLSRY